MRKYRGNSNAVLKYLGFLISDHSLRYDYTETEAFCGPSETYSFHNENGCFTLHHLCQRGEWGWFYASKFSKNQSELLQKEIRQADYIKGPVFGHRRMLKMLSASIQAQIAQSGSFFGIELT